MTTPKRANKNKQEIAAEMNMKEVVKKERELAGIIFDAIKDQDSIYDAQTAVNALAGYIKYELNMKQHSLVLNDLLVDLKNEKDSKVKTAIERLKSELQGEKALDTAELLERFGKNLVLFGADKYMKNPMSIIKLEDFVAK